MQEPIDRAAMIEAASRSLRLQMAKGAARERPRSKGSLHDGSRGSSGVEALGAVQGGEPLHSAENAQRRIRSAENQHRMVSSASRDGRPRDPMAASGPIATISHVPPAALDINAEDDLDEDVQPGATASPAAAVLSGIEDGPGPFPHDFAQELKRPLSRKKDPSASAAAGLGAFSGPARMTDAFEQRKTRQPIPVESWGPRPPSRAGLPGAQKAAPLDEGLADVDPKILLEQTRGRGGVGGGGSSSSNVRPGGAKTAGDQAAKPSGTWAAARAEPGGTWAAARAESRVQSETRNRGRDRRGVVSRGNGPEAYTSPTELGVFGYGTGAPSQRLSKSLSGVFDHHNTPFKEQRGGTASWTGSPFAGSTSSWSPQVDPVGTLEVSGSGLLEPAGGPWGTPGDSLQGGSPPTRKGGRPGADGVSVEDVEAESELGGPHYRRDSTPPQVIVTRSSQMKTRGNVRRTTDPRQGGQPMPFTTSLDVDFLSLFAS
jgi:hypothetical protein